MPKKLHIDIPLLKVLVEEEQLQLRIVAAKLGAHEETIRRVCKNLGIKTQKTGPRRGDKHPGWKGGTTYIRGYKLLYSPDHPHHNKQRRVLEHRLVVEQREGRYLKPEEVVHHIDGDITNNSPNNLEIFETNGVHRAYEILGRIKKISKKEKLRLLAVVENIPEHSQPQIHIRRKHKESDDRPQPQTTPPNPT